MAGILSATKYESCAAINRLSQPTHKTESAGFKNPG
jgi:hypothetical protein